MSHQVFIERCRDGEPATAEALARAIAERYGVAPEQILGRLRKGRFRVKANLELAAAKTFMAYLETEGALCSVVDAGGAIVARSQALGAAPAPVDETPSGEIDMALHTPPPGSLPSIGASTSASDYESGLSAAFGERGEEQRLGALEDGSTSGALTLSTLDGKSGLEVKEAAAGTPAKAVDTSRVDAFLPPEMANESALVLDIEAPSPPTPTVRASTSNPALEAFDEIEVASAPRVTEPAQPAHLRLLGLLGSSERFRFALGVSLAVLLGFLAIHIFASGQEESRYAEVTSKLQEEYQAASTPAAWEVLEDARVAALSTLQSRRRSIAITSVLIWSLFALLFVFAWLRLINWSRWQDLAPARTQAE